jgi:ribonuclease P protein component
LIWRIHGRRAFDEIARTGRVSRTKTLWCRYVNDPSAAPLRVGFAVGRSYGRATERNLLRRRLRAIVNESAPTSGLTAGLLLIGARPSARELTFEALQQEVGQLLTSAAAITPPKHRASTP